MSANDELQAHTCEKMLEFYEKPQDYVKKSHNKQDLTEQWKKGELEEWVYYYIKINNKTIPAKLSKYGNFYLTEGACGRSAMRNVEEVLAPVPSYEEWNQLHKFLEEFNALDVAKENQQLKELLKQWVHFYPIVLYEYEDTLKTRDIVELYEKTTNAIGEKK